MSKKQVRCPKLLPRCSQGSHCVTNRVQGSVSASGLARGVCAMHRELLPGSEWHPGEDEQHSPRRAQQVVASAWLCCHPGRDLGLVPRPPALALLRKPCVVWKLSEVFCVYETQFEKGTSGVYTQAGQTLARCMLCCVNSCTCIRYFKISP